MYEDAKNWLDQHPYSEEEYDSYDDWIAFFEEEMKDRFGERGVSSISVGEYSEDESLADVADCMLRFARHHKVLDYTVLYSMSTDSTWVIIKYADRLEVC